jgi:hypothetical protein
MIHNSAVRISAAVLVSAAFASAGQLPSADEIARRMVEHESRRLQSMYGYTSVRRYHLLNPGHKTEADMLVRVTVSRTGAKTFEVLAQHGSPSVCRFIFTRMLQTEQEAARPEVLEANRIIPSNYSFELVGMDQIGGRSAYILKATPRVRTKYLIEGRVWIDARDFAIVRIEGAPAKAPSFWVKSVRFVHTYQQQGPFWLAAADHSETDARIFGLTNVDIDYLSYSLNPPDSERRASGADVHHPVVLPSAFVPLMNELK